MLFNSLAFLLFFPLVCIVYFTLPTIKLRNWFLLAASYYFYMNWRPVYALLLLASTGITYLAALGGAKYDKHKTLFLTLGIVFNLLILFFFKYFNFAAENVTALMAFLGVKTNIPEFRVLLPVGISFYIFQAMGYMIDVYRGDIKPEKNFFTYALFVSFFPQLVAGPIERSTNLLPQFKKKLIIDYDRVMEGVRLMVWGYFMKLVLADRCALFVDTVFNNIGYHNGGSYLVASLIFPFQLYGDFAGYSYIAIGAARVLGFRLMDNFRRPYFFSTSIQEYWKRNHISLTSWFMDYVYYPMVGNSTKLWWWCFAIFITFFISGFWHGAAWTYVVCFSIHGIYLVTCILKDKRQKKFEKKYGLKKKEWWLWINRILTFILVVITLIFFRANTLQDAVTVMVGIFTNFGAPRPEYAIFVCIAIAMIVLIIKEFADEYKWKIRVADSPSWLVRHVYLILMICYIILFGVLGGDQFIYFQF